MLDELRCPTCSKILGSRNALQRHKREVHSEEMVASPVAAAVAPTAEGSGNSRASSSSGSWQGGGGGGSLSFQLQQQQQSQPDAASARVACEKCGRTFKNKSNLKIHMLTHSGVKPFW